MLTVFNLYTHIKSTVLILYMHEGDTRFPYGSAQLRSHFVVTFFLKLVLGLSNDNNHIHLCVFA